jgi:hypothetical protein
MWYSNPARALTLFSEMPSFSVARIEIRGWKEPLGMSAFSPRYGAERLGAQTKSGYDNPQSVQADFPICSIQPRISIRATEKEAPRRPEMPNVIILYDETLWGERTPALRLSLLSSHITLRELIRRRIFEEVQEHHAAPGAPFRGLVTPSENERVLNEDKASSTATLRRIDWEAQFARACEAFERNGFFVLVGDRQVENLDDEIELKVETVVSFVKLVPLVGG